MRLPDWPERLDAFLESVRRTPFRYGSRAHDCGVFAAGGVMALTGEDKLAEFGAYRGGKQAAALVAREGGMTQMLAKRFTQIPPAFARRGDLGLIAAHGAAIPLGICVVLGDMLAKPGKAELELIPRALLLHAFRV